MSGAIGRSDGRGAPDRRTVAVTMGDPGGIGPEIIVKALADPARRSGARYRVFGCAPVLHAAAERAGIEPYWWRVEQSSDLVEAADAHDVVVLDYEGCADGRYVAQPTKLGGELSLRFVEDAIAAAKRPAGDPRKADAIVTAPISKKAWNMTARGHHPGHTELLAARFGVKRVGMFFESPKLRVILATVHAPLTAIPGLLTIGRVFDAIDLGNEACRGLGVERPRIAVCGLNPHAGEDGLLGDEEERLIAPAIRAAQEGGIDARGPLPGDTVFNAAVRGEYDLVVAMYHDQGLIPVKLLAWDKAVNVTVGLPVPRTSPDHGTAFDIAGKNRADAGSMGAALDLAVRLASAARAAAM